MHIRYLQKQVFSTNAKNGGFFKRADYSCRLTFLDAPLSQFNHLLLIENISYL
jgi:hypothetical protein